MVGSLQEADSEIEIRMQEVYYGNAFGRGKKEKDWVERKARLEAISGTNSVDP